MPVVPFSPRPQGQPDLPKPDDPWVLMAAATMDSEGRLVRPQMKDVTLPEGARSRTPEGYQQYEDTVDQFVKDQKLEKGDRFRVPGDNESDPRIYEYLGPNSGGRKDWRELRSKGES